MRFAACRWWQGLAISLAAARRGAWPASDAPGAEAPEPAGGRHARGVAEGLVWPLLGWFPQRRC